MNFHLDNHPDYPANAVELPEFGYICPNQFADGEFQHPAIEELLPADEATAAAQEIANQLRRPAKVEYQHQFWTGHGFEAPHALRFITPRRMALAAYRRVRGGMAVVEHAYAGKRSGDP
ncbi:MAG: hypothetical protein Q7U74_02020, partial [Saprospiraceae bacterium]|nr:hypothetical protein [Saprospiraceae bacterium]